MDIKIEKNKNVLVLVQLETNKSFRFPIIWLRDNCQCHDCFDKVTSCRSIDWEHFDLNRGELRDVNLNDANHSVKINWTDGHSSSFELEWLIKRSFNQDTQESYLNLSYQQAKKFWTKSDFVDAFAKFDFNDILQSDEVFVQWLEHMATYGIALIENTPNTKNEVRKIAERVGFIKKTHYGDEFTVTKKKSTTAYAYRPLKLQLHVDMPYYEQMPGINMLHCVTQSRSGGGNTLVDGFYIAELLRQTQPSFFRVLSSVRVNWCDYGEENGMKHEVLLRAPVICVDQDNKVTRINYNNTQRDSFFSENIDDVFLWYEAYAEFVKLMHTEIAEFKLRDGHILTFDNIRILHGRSTYADTADNSRCVVGVYVDWDQMYSRWRVLKPSNCQF